VPITCRRNNQLKIITMRRHDGNPRTVAECHLTALRTSPESRFPFNFPLFSIIYY